MTVPVFILALQHQDGTSLMLFDSHAHLDMLTDDPGELERILTEDFAGGLSAVVQVSTDPDIHFNIYSKLNESSRNIHFACGLTHAFSGDVEKGLRKLTNIVESGQVCALGEIGLDFSRGPEPSAVQRQKDLFGEQMAIARRGDLPVILHTRDAAAETLAVLDMYPGVRGVAHCFTGDAGFAAALVERGWMVSFSGILTFASAGALRQVAAGIPGESLLVETDTPFLSPVPFRGQPNRPARVAYTAAALAEIRGVSPGYIAGLTAENARRLFGINENRDKVSL